MRSIVTLVAVVAMCGGAALASTYTNPVIAPVAADPSLIRAADGTWYLYATQDRWDDGVEHYLPIFRSPDLVKWEFVGDVFIFPPRWKSQGFLWAPDISLVGDTYHLYYSYSTWVTPIPVSASRPAPRRRDRGRTWGDRCSARATSGYATRSTPITTSQPTAVAP